MVATRVTDAAKLDFRVILRQTAERFGTRQRAVYRRLIAQSVKMIADDPTRGGSWDRGNVVPGLRAFHLEIAAGRRGAAAHMLYYAVDHSPDGTSCVVILRLLHESMEPQLHITRTDPDRPLESR